MEKYGTVWNPGSVPRAGWSRGVFGPILWKSMEIVWNSMEKYGKLWKNI